MTSDRVNDIVVSPIIISGERVEARYGRRTALSISRLEISVGLTAIVGPNGSGKTTLLRVLAGLHRPRCRSLVIAGCDFTRRRPLAKAVAYVPQNAGVAPNFTVNSFLEYAFWLYKLEKGSRASQIDRVSAACGLTHLLDKRLASLSGGERRRVVIAQALLPPSKVLLVDEISANLDLASKRIILDALVEAARSAAVVMVTHEFADIVSRADQLQVLADGRPRYQGNMAAFSQRTLDGFTAKYDELLASSARSAVGPSDAQADD